MRRDSFDGDEAHPGERHRKIKDAGQGAARAGGSWVSNARKSGG